MPIAFEICVFHRQFRIVDIGIVSRSKGYAIEHNFFSCPFNRTLQKDTTVRRLASRKSRPFRIPKAMITSDYIPGTCIVLTGGGVGAFYYLRSRTFSFGV